MRNVKINRNGDEPDALLEQLACAIAALGDLKEAIRTLTIHGRNYQTYTDKKPVDAYYADVQDKIAAWSKLEEIQKWLYESVENINGQL